MAKILVLLLLVVGCSNSAKKRELADLHMRIGTGYLIKGHYPQALSELQLAAELDPESAIIQNNLGLAYYVRKEYARAEQHINKALSIDPAYSDARNNLGRLYIDLARYDAAVAELGKVIKDLTYPTPEKAHVNLGLAYMKKGEMDAALGQFKKSIESNTRFCPGHNYFGQVQFQMQKYEAAIESFERALKLCNSHYDEAHYFSALSYFKAGQREKAQARLEEVVQNYPDSEYSQKAKAMLKIIQ